MVIVEMENGKQIKLEMDRSAAPNTVDNFLHLASTGFYDGLIFHRVIKGFMIQGGDPEGTGTGGPGYSIKGEFRANGVQNLLKHKRGVISMARSGNPNSAGSQFFIMHQDAPHLDGQYAAFGKVTEGLDVVDEIAGTPTGSGDRPKAPVRIKSVRVENEGEIKEPVKI
jgi:peptidyl-prolyl cis-trans isomerase B (cyclophilin B)